MNANAKIEEPAKAVKITDAREFLPAALEVMETPPRPLRRLLAFLISLFFVIAIVWAAVSPVDIVAVSEGKVVPDGQIKIVQPSQPGIVSAIHVAEGDHVERGDVVIELDANEVRTNRERAELDLLRSDLDRAVAEALLSNDPPADFSPPDGANGRLIELSRSVIKERWQSYLSALDENAAELSRLKSSIAAYSTEKTATIETLEEFKELNETAIKLDNVGLATKSQLANLRLQLISAGTQLQSVDQQIDQAKLNLTSNRVQLQQITATFRSQVNAELTASQQAILIATEELLRQLEREELHKLRAPVSGTVNEILLHTIGAVVSSSEKLLTIVPDGVSMRIEASLENRDIGFVELGQDVEIKLEAFPFTHYGVINGTVIHISPDAIVDPVRGPIYTIHVAPDEDVLRAGDQEIHLSPGMRATAEIKTGKRTILEFFLAPLLRYKDEAIRER